MVIGLFLTGRGAYGILEVKTMRILIYNDQTDKMETYSLRCSDNMPYTACCRFTVGEFMRNSHSRTIGWSTRRFLKSTDELVRRYGQKPRVSRAFRRAWDAEEPMILTHMLGTAVDMGRNLSLPGLQQLVTLAEDQELFDVITDLEHTRIEAHLHHQNEAASDFVPFTQIQKGDKNTEVCVAQDALWALGYPITKISGVFDAELDQAVRAFQRDHGLVADGIAGKLTWESLMSQLRPIPGIDEETAA